MANLQRPDRATLRTGAACDATRTFFKAGIDQFESSLRAYGDAGPAITAGNTVNSDHKP